MQVNYSISVSNIWSINNKTRRLFNRDCHKPLCHFNPNLLTQILFNSKQMLAMSLLVLEAYQFVYLYSDFSCLEISILQRDTVMKESRWLYFKWINTVVLFYYHCRSGEPLFIKYYWNCWALQQILFNCLKELSQFYTSLWPIIVTIFLKLIKAKSQDYILC